MSRACYSPQYGTTFPESNQDSRSLYLLCLDCTQVDAVSFPLELESLPQLAHKGAFSPDHSRLEKTACPRLLPFSRCFGLIGCTLVAKVEC